ncbi:K+/H+ antiporter subunit F [Roseomonas sp. SSH11]|uniref:K+/H+ antiporter subunit F n=2 Tax=Pararoseomonas baculiformis TaxID=2820812 RepID=A0ABS4AKZ5_9PROT|nr:K+/H+ antiporter subunit F [Pararoseomonas baculiformis]
MLGWAVFLAQLLLVAAMGCATLRLLRGPRAQDRVLALDTLYVIAAMLLLVFGIRTGSPHYFEAALLITLLGFVATAALSKFLMRGEVIE